MRRNAGVSSRRLRRVALMAKQTSLVYLLVNAVVFAVGVGLATQHGAVDMGVGASLVAAGITGWVTFLYVALQQEERDRLRRLATFGLHDAFPSRSVEIKPRYDERLLALGARLDILGFGLKTLRQDYKDDFPVWAARARVRILLMHPTSPYADARDAEEGSPQGTIASEVREFLAETSAVRAQHPDMFQVRLYQALPSVNMFRVDGEMFFGPYLLDGPSRKTPTLLLTRGVLYDRLDAHFDSLWSDEHSSPAPP